MFFDACDGFFTNYNWTEQSLEVMKDYSAVKSRQADVYIGVDVFARGIVVGGMLETNKVCTVDRGRVRNHILTCKRDDKLYVVHVVRSDRIVWSLCT